MCVDWQAQEAWKVSWEDLSLDHGSWTSACLCHGCMRTQHSPNTSLWVPCPQLFTPLRSFLHSPEARRPSALHILAFPIPFPLNVPDLTPSHPWFSCSFFLKPPYPRLSTPLPSLFPLLDPSCPCLLMLPPSSASLLPLSPGSSIPPRPHLSTPPRLTRSAPLAFGSSHPCLTSLCLRLGRGLAESFWGMGGTLVTNECHLFDW